MQRIIEKLSSIQSRLKHRSALNISFGFTIVELLVVIVVIGVLATITVVSYTGISAKAKEAAVVSDLTNTTKQFKIFQIENSNYPADIELNCITPINPANKCMKLSADNTLGKYIVDNTAGNQSFCLTIKNGINIIKHIDHDGLIADGACTYAFPSTIAANNPAPTTDTITLSWPQVTGAQSFVLERATSADFTTNKQTLTAPAPSATSYASTGLIQGTTYYYRMNVTINGDTSNWGLASATTRAIYTLTVNTNNGTYGSATGGGSFDGDTVHTITATPNSGYLFGNWTGDASCNGLTTTTVDITMNNNKTCTANFVVNPWIDGIAATVLAGKKVRNADLGTMYYYKTTNTAVVSPQGATGLDPDYPSNMILVDPQTNPGVDFSAYPAQNACKAIGGRLPNTRELVAIYTGKASYGNNFQATFYWSSTSYSNNGAYSVSFSNGSPYFGSEAVNAYVRCISG